MRCRQLLPRRRRMCAVPVAAMRPWGGTVTSRQRNGRQQSTTNDRPQPHGTGWRAPVCGRSSRAPSLSTTTQDARCASLRRPRSRIWRTPRGAVPLPPPACWRLDVAPHASNGQRASRLPSMQPAKTNDLSSVRRGALARRGARYEQHAERARRTMPRRIRGRQASSIPPAAAHRGGQVVFVRVCAFTWVRLPLPAAHRRGVTGVSP